MPKKSAKEYLFCSVAAEARRQSAALPNFNWDHVVPGA